MHSLHTITSSEKLSLYYHDLFDYPLTFADLIKWNTSENVPINCSGVTIVCQNGYYFLQGRGNLVYIRVIRSRISAKKLEIAKKASEALSFIPSVKMVAVTGSLAMENAIDESDIDLLVITSKNTLWLSRLVILVLLLILHIPVRRSNNRSQRDKLCMNVWLDESDLVWSNRDRNLYTAHEIAQIIPLVNKDKTYEKFLFRNKWILNFWPNSVQCKRIVGSDQRLEKKLLANYCSPIISLFENICFWIQYQHMKSKITREVVTKTRAIFHPRDWGKVVLLKLNKNNGIF